MKVDYGAVVAQVSAYSGHELVEPQALGEHERCISESLFIGHAWDR